MNMIDISMVHLNYIMKTDTSYISNIFTWKGFHLKFLVYYLMSWIAEWCCLLFMWCDVMLIHIWSNANVNLMLWRWKINELEGNTDSTPSVFLIEVGIKWIESKLSTTFYWKFSGY